MNDGTHTSTPVSRRRSATPCQVAGPTEGLCINSTTVLGSSAGLTRGDGSSADQHRIDGESSHHHPELFDGPAADTLRLVRGVVSSISLATRDGGLARARPDGTSRQRRRRSGSSTTGEEPLRHVVLDEHLRQQDEEQDLPGPANSRTLTANTLLFRDRRALPEWTLIPALFFGPSEAPPHVVD